MKIPIGDIIEPKGAVMKSPKSRLTLSLAFLLAWATAACGSAAETAESPVNAKNALAPHVLLTITKETTFVTAP
jgi:hypothetical protein